MTVKKKAVGKSMTLEAFLKTAGPGEPLETLVARHEEDAAWAGRAFEGKEPLGESIRLRRGRPRTGEEVTPTVVKAIRLPVLLLERLQATAKAQGLSLNALLQVAVAEYLTHHRGA